METRLTNGLVDDARLGRIGDLVSFVLLKTVTADAIAVAVLADAANVLTNESVAFFGSLLSQNLDGFVPSHHSLVRLSAENPVVAAVHATALAALEHEFVRRGTGLRVRTQLLLGQVQRHNWRLRVDLVGRLELMQVSRRQDVPPRCVALEILALAFQHSSSDLSCCRSVLSRVVDVLNTAERQSGVDKVGIGLDKARPFKVLGHSDGTSAKLLDGVVGIIALTLENAGHGIVCLLNLSHDNRFEFAARALEVKVCAVEVVFLINLLLNHAINSKADNVRVGLAIIAVVCVLQGLGKLVNRFACCVLLFVDRVLEVTVETLDLLNLLAQIATQASESGYDILLNIAGLVRFCDRVLVVVAENARRISQTTIGDEDRRVRKVGQNVGHFQQSFATRLVARLDLSEVGDERLQ